MKKILLIFQNYRREIHQAIFDYAQSHDWTLEYFTYLPKYWEGDGILTDTINAKDLEAIRQGEKVPVVTRTHCIGKRIGNVFGDVEAIAEMAADYFQHRGFRNLAGIDKSTWEFDPCRRFIELVRERGLEAKHFCWARNSDDNDHRQALLKTREFVRNLPKPAGIFLGGMYCANIVFRACEAEGISIPHEVAILSNDDDPFVCESFHPRLSGISGEINHIGLAMARMLDHMMSDPKLSPTPCFTAPEKIITRQSTDVLAVSHVPTAKAINYIFENYSKLIGVEDVSRHAGLSLNVIQRNFRQYVGKVPNEFLREIRMKRAKELLEETDDTLDQIAKQTGYSCAMTFYAAFRRIYKMTPGAYRRQTRSDAS